MTGRDNDIILQDVELPPNTTYSSQRRDILDTLDGINTNIAGSSSLTLQRSSPITNLPSFRPSLATASPMERVADEQIPLALHNITTRMSSLCAPRSDTEIDLFSMTLFSNPLGRYVLEDATLNSTIREIISFPQKKDLARQKADLLAAPYMDVISDIANVAFLAASDSPDPNPLSDRISALSPEHSGIIQMVMDEFGCTL